MLSFAKNRRNDMRSYRYLHLDVFTDRRFGGNQLAVFLDGRDLEPSVMQAIAKEMAFSETTFVLPAERPDTDVRMRIFTPAAELPMAGHPTVGSAFALARAGVIPAGRDRFVFGLGVGPTPVDLIWKNGELGFAWMTQQTPVFGDPLADPGRAGAMLGLPATAVTGTGVPVQVVSCGVPFLLVPVTTRRAVDGAALERAAFEAFVRATGVNAHGVFVFSLEPGPERATAYSRMFAPELGVVEDPATGSASGPLGCYLVRHRLVPLDKAGAMLSLQGVKMGRPSAVHIAIADQGGEITGVRVGGESVIVGEGTIYL
jgi:trans-2,3-dihydro-3-hydroxyanthranilate isomerase